MIEGNSVVTVTVEDDFVESVRNINVGKHVGRICTIDEVAGIGN